MLTSWTLARQQVYCSCLCPGATRHARTCFLRAGSQHNASNDVQWCLDRGGAANAGSTWRPRCAASKRTRASATRSLPPTRRQPRRAAAPTLGAGPPSALRCSCRPPRGSWSRSASARRAGADPQTSSVRGVCQVCCGLAMCPVCCSLGSMARREESFPCVRTRYHRFASAFA